MVWNRQSNKIAEMLLQENQNAVVELIMGLGKTSTILPIYAAMVADGSQSVFNIYPSTVSETNIKYLSDLAQHVYGSSVNGFMFSRSFPKAKEEVEALSVAIHSSAAGTVSGMTKEDAQSLELSLFDSFYHYKRASWKDKLAQRSAIESSRNVLKTMRKSKAIADEAHDLFNCYQELNFPIGQQSSIKDSYYRVIEHCMRLASSDIRLQILISQNNLPRLNLKTYLDSIASKIAKQMLDYPLFEMAARSEKERIEFVSYVSGKLPYIPQWIQEHPNFSEIAMAKGCLTVLLPNAFQRVVSVNFDAATFKSKGEYARPAEGNNNVKDNSCIRMPYEALVKTFLMLFCKGLDGEQCLTLIEELRKKAEKIAKARKISCEETAIYKNFDGLVKSCHIFKNKQFSQEQLQEIIEQFGKHPDAIQLYIRYFVNKQIPYWKYNLRSNSLNFASQFDTIISDTGTPYNDGTYPHHCRMLWDEGTIGEAYHIMKKKCPTNGIHILENDLPNSLLQEILQRFFNRGSDFTAIIDGGALFKGVNNEVIARQILAHAQIHLPHIKAVKFFRKNEFGRDELVWIEVGADKATAIDSERHPPEECISYFDHPHTFASDIPQQKKAKGLELVGEQVSDQTLQRYLQDVFRMRGLKKEERLVKDPSDNTNRTQTIEFAMTKAAQKKISGSAIPTLDDIVKFGITNEAARAKEDNYIAQIQKIEDVIRRAIVDEMLNAGSFDKAFAIWEEFESVLVNVLEDDPKKLYGLIDTKVDFKTALDLAVKKALKPIENSTTFSNEKLIEIKHVLEDLSNPPAETMPEQVSVYTNGKDLFFDTLQDLNKETQMYEQAGEVETSNENANENENENENQEDVQNEQNQQQRYNLFNLFNRFTEQEWPEDLEILDLSWMRFTELQSYFKESLLKTLDRWAYIITTVNALPFPLFTWNDLIKNETSSALQKINTAFDSRLWCSNQFIPKQVLMWQNEVQVGSKEQCNLFEVLVHYTEKEDGTIEIDHVGTLTIKEAGSWRKLLAGLNDKQKKDKKKVILFDITNRIDVAGSLINLEKLRQNQDFQRLEVMLLFLNGQIKYQKQHIPILKKWLGAHNPAKMKSAFIEIHKNRGKGVFEGSDISLIFDELLNVPWTNSI